MILLKKILLESFSKKTLNRKGKHPSKINNRKSMFYDDELDNSGISEPDNSIQNLQLYSDVPSRITNKFRYITDQDEAELIQSQYENFAKKAGIEPANLIYHLLSGHGIVWTSFQTKKNISANYFVGNFVADIFTVSHFAPKSLQTGHMALVDFLNQSTPVIFAVPEKLAVQLERIGFKKIFKKVPMRFRGSVIEKTILINKAFEKKDYDIMLAHWMSHAIESGLIDDHPKVKEFFNRLQTYVLNKKNKDSTKVLNKPNNASL